MAHVDQVVAACSQFLSDLLKRKAVGNTYARHWPQIRDALKRKRESATDELECMMADMKGYPINYNHHYTDAIKKRRRMRGRDEFAECIKAATTSKPRTEPFSSEPSSNHTVITTNSINSGKAIGLFFDRIDSDMEKHTCEEVLDSLYAIYKVNSLQIPVKRHNLTTYRLARRSSWPASQHK